MNRIYHITVTGWDADNESISEEVLVLAESADKAVEGFSLSDLRYVTEIGEASITGSHEVRTGALAVVTSQLQQGDIVLEHGMQCLIDRPVEISRSHPDSPGAGDGKTRYTQALVLNRDDKATSVVPRSWTADWKRDGSPLPHDGQHRWGIQGNDRALWYVQRGVIVR